MPDGGVPCMSRARGACSVLGSQTLPDSAGYLSRMALATMQVPICACFGVMHMRSEM